MASLRSQESSRIAAASEGGVSRSASKQALRIVQTLKRNCAGNLAPLLAMSLRRRVLYPLLYPLSYPILNRRRAQRTTALADAHSADLVEPGIFGILCQH